MKNKINAEIKFRKNMELKYPHYDLSKYIYINVDTPGIIVCKLNNVDGTIHGEFLRTPYYMNKKGKCPICVKIELQKNRKTNEQYILDANKKHNYKYDYSLTDYQTAKSLIKVICNQHGIFEVIAHSHLNGGAGCPKCSHTFNKSTLIFIEESKKVHFNEDYIYNQVNYKNIFTHVSIGCNKLYQEDDFYDLKFKSVKIGQPHGYWRTTPDNHLRGRKCPICSKIEKAKKLRKSNDEFIEQLKNIYPNYNLSKINYKGDKTKVLIRCNNINHNWFLITPNNLLSGHGCKYCTNHISKPETEWLDFLKVPLNYRQAFLKINNKKFYLDAFDPMNNTIYEFYGDYWHGNPLKFSPDKINQRNKKTFQECYNKTIEKENIIKSAGYNLITIWESDWNKIKKEMNMENK